MPINIPRNPRPPTGDFGLAANASLASQKHILQTSESYLQRPKKRNPRSHTKNDEGPPRGWRRLKRDKPMVGQGVRAGLKGKRIMNMDAQDLWRKRPACFPGHSPSRTGSSPESASRAPASRPGYPVHPVYPCSITGKIPIPGIGPVDAAGAPTPTRPNEGQQ